MLIILSCQNAANDFLKNCHFIHLCWQKKIWKNSEDEKKSRGKFPRGYKGKWMKKCVFSNFGEIMLLHTMTANTFLHPVHLFHSFFPTPINFELEFQRRKINEKKQRGWGKCYPSPLLVRLSSLFACRLLPPRNAFNCNDNTTAIFLTGEKPTEV